VSRQRLVVAAATAVLALLTSVPAAEARIETTAPTLYITIHVTLNGPKVTLTPRNVPRGAAARFIMVNVGAAPVTFTVGARTPGLTTPFGFTTVVDAHHQQIKILYLATRGVVPFYEGRSLSKAAGEAKGKLLVGATCALCQPPGPPIPP
jgi:hypothetical protein